jgi:hypothetical protein
LLYLHLDLKDKAIKKTYKILFIIFVAFLFVSGTGFLLLQQKKFQAKVLPYLVTQLEQILETEVQIDSIEAKFFKRLVLHKVYIKDYKNDTLFYCDVVSIGVQRINLDKKSLYLNHLVCEGLLVNFHDETGDSLNFDVFLKKLSKGPKKKEGQWHVSSRKVEVRNSVFAYRVGHNSKLEPGFFDTKDFRLNDLNIFTEDFIIDQGQLDFNITDMSLLDKSGFGFAHFMAKAQISKKGIIFDSPYIETRQSVIIGKRIAMLHESFKDFKDQGIINIIPWHIELEPSNINFGDIAFFSPKMEALDQNFIFSGLVTGTINALKGKDVSIKIGSSSSLHANVYFNGLPDVERTYIHADIQKLYANIRDIEKLQLPGVSQSIQLPAIIDKMGNMEYKGNFTGFFKDFFSYGTLSSGLGTINTDISVRPDTSNILVLKGNIELVGFDAGKLLSFNNMGSTTLLAGINGKFTPDSGFVANLNGTIKSLYYNQYDYKNLIVEAAIAGPNVSSSLEIDDENIKASIIGDFNNLNKVPDINCRLMVEEANLGALHFMDSLYKVGFHLFTKFQGNEVNNLNGYFNMQDLLFVKSNDSLKMGDLYVDVSNKKNEGYSGLSLISEVLDAEINGNFAFSSLWPSFQNIVFQYIDNIHHNKKHLSLADSNKFNYWLDIKDIQPLLTFMLPGVSVSANTFLKGKYNAFINQYDINLVSPYLVVDDLIVKGIQCNTRSDDSLLSLEVGCEYLMMNQVRFENLTLISSFFDNQTDINLRWNNWDSVIYKGNLHATARFNKTDSLNKRNLDIELYPSNFTVHDTIWNLGKGLVSLDSSSILCSGIEIYNGNQSFRMEGAVSKNPDDTLKVDFENFRLDNLNLLLASFGTKVNGILNGGVAVSDFYNNRVILSTFEAHSFAINNVEMGNLYAISGWDKKKQQVAFDINTLKGELKAFQVKGMVEPSTRAVRASATLDKFRLALIQPYLTGIFSDIKGLASGHCEISGTTHAPLLNGELNLQRAELKVDYLGTAYSFTDVVKIRDNHFLIDKMKMYDRFGNLAVMNGAINNNNLKDFGLDLSINTAKFLLLETTVYDNPDFFGTAFAAGNIFIKGPVNRLSIDIRVRTAANTEFNVPLSTTSSNANEFSFIEFYPKKQVDDDELYLLGQVQTVKRNNSLLLNFDLEVTPDAQVQLIFDSKVGDIIKGRAQGNLKMEINTSGTFKMYGNLDVTEGDYLFTRNVFNRKFKIKEGGSIQWNGSPTEAIINLQAVYNVRTSVDPLMPQDGANEGEKGNNVMPVECQLFLTDNLMQPTTKFGINLPTANEDLRSIVNNILSSDEELSKQFISLLIMNSFIAPDDMGFFTNRSGAINVAAIELVSNQLSHMLSQFNENLNIYIDYYNDPDWSRQELELVLQYQMFKNKVTINSEFDVPTQNSGESSNNTMIGDFDLDVKLTDNGKLRLKAFNREHSGIIDLDPYYTQGVGFLFREEFNTFGELFKSYYSKIFSRNKEAIKEDEDLILN